MMHLCSVGLRNVRGDGVGAGLQPFDWRRRHCPTSSRLLPRTPHLGGRQGWLDEGAGNSFEQAQQIDLLLIMAANRIALLLSGCDANAESPMNLA